MNRVVVALLLSGWFHPIAWGGSPPNALPNALPNVLVIFADDLGSGMPWSEPSPNPELSTAWPVRGGGLPMLIPPQRAGFYPLKIGH